MRVVNFYDEQLKKERTRFIKLSKHLAKKQMKKSGSLFQIKMT